MRKILLLFILLLVQNSNAQSVLRFQHINVDDGLSQSSVNHIFQDCHGFIWMATGDGLNRYDGKQFIVYKSRFGDTLPDAMKDRNINSKILEDKYHRLWFNSDVGLSYMDTRTGKVKIVLDKYTTAYAGALLTIDNEGVWVAIPRKGFYCVDVNTLKAKRYPFIDKYQTGKDVDIIKNGVATEKGFWICDETGIIYFDRRSGKDERKILQHDINSINLLRNGNLVLGVTNGIELYDPIDGHREFINTQDDPADGAIEWRTFAEDTISGAVYMGSTYGGVVCKLNIPERKHELLKFQNNVISDLFIDRSENLWVGTDGNGVFKINVKQPKFFCLAAKPIADETEQNSLFVKSIYREGMGKIWLGVYNNGLLTCDPVSGKQEKITISASTDDQLISTIIKDSCGNMVATIGNTVVWIDPHSTKVMARAVLPVIPGLPTMQPLIYALVEWKKGHYLVGTNLGIYAVIRTSGMPVSKLPSSFQDNFRAVGWAYNFHKMPDNIIYVGTRSGFFKTRVLSDSQIQIMDKGFADIPIRHFYKSSNHPVLWIASEQGLIAYNEQTKHYKTFDERSGLSNSFIYAILEENDSSLWVSTNNGLANVRVQYGNDVHIGVQVTNFTIRDGLQSSEFNTGAYFKGDNGMLYFGGIAGINWFQPGAVRSDTLRPKPAISGIFINDSLYAGDTAIYVREITVPYDRNTISISLASLEFTKPGQSVFSYKLEGQDKDWVYTTSDLVRYANLPPGVYEFKLRVSNTDGIKNETPVKLTIIVQPPYWQTWWFRTLCATAALALISLAIRYYTRQKIRVKTQLLEKQQALYLERLRISKDVHDDLGSGLSKISLMAAIAQKKTADNLSLGNDMRQISSVSKELVDNMRDLVWVLNPDNTSLEQLVSRLREYCADYLENIPIAVVLHFPEDVPSMRISREAQRNIFLTVKEAINNCIKHSDATAINISLTLHIDKMEITITDNGRGFDLMRLKGSGNGLRNMKQRIESIGGTFLVTSSPLNSTTINITITFNQLCAEKITL